MLTLPRKFITKSLFKWQPSFPAMRNFSSRQCLVFSPQKDINIRGISQGFIDANYKQSWYYFFQLCNQDKLDLISHSALSELLRSIQLPTHDKTVSHEARRHIQQKISILLKVMDSNNYKSSEADLRYLVSIYSLLGNYSEARITWDKLSKAYPQPELQSYTALALCFNRERKFSSVPVLHQQIKKAGLRMNHKFLQCVIEAYGLSRSCRSAAPTRLLCPCIECTTKVRTCLF
ncbi:hypothetical protein DSO57_1033337 [Entomophthora muscae]|uniref:Uncharacterized protein n=1 Tax=Entomophthora muscae TaxID=34485 RepID=A0ACC2RES8_9FUNG|nr:hypothetical protein DSO57_1033337 [Entomophthora muscae]